jgi:multidrug efflux pump
MVAILLAGLAAYTQLPVSALPQVDYPTIQIVTFLPGASPEVMVTSVTAPMERQFGEIPGLSQMTSTSSGGSSVITLQFILSEDIDVAEQDVQAAINAAGTYLPGNLPNPPIYNKVNPADAPILTLALTSDTLPLTTVEDDADTILAQKISQLSGVGLVSINGGEKPAVRVQGNPTALASYGMSLEDLRTALGTANVDQAKGSLSGPRQSFTIGANDQLLSSADYKNVIIAYHNGDPVRLSDVATVIDGAENNTQAAWVSTLDIPEQTPAVIMNIQRQPGANIISVVDRIRTLLPVLQASLPAAIKVQILTDRTSTIRASVNDVKFELLLTIGLVVMVIFLFLRNLAATIIPSIAVPLSIIGTFGVMYLLGYSLDNLSLMALTISTGFVVDDAIVMIENISRYLEEGDAPLEAALKGAEQIGFTIVALTLSLIAVLIPLLFMGDIVGRLFREFAVTLGVTILVSAIVSLTLTPMMCAKILRHKPADQQSRFYNKSEEIFDWVIAKYAVGVRWVLRHQTLMLLSQMGVILLTVVLFIIVPKGFFPVEDTGVILGITETQQTISFAGMGKAQQALARVLMQNPNVESLSSFIGVDGTNTTVNSGRIQINLKPLSERSERAPQLIRDMADAAAQVEGIKIFMQPLQDLTVEDRVSRTEYQYSVEDADPNELATWSQTLLSEFGNMKGTLIDVASDQENKGLEENLVIDRDTASRLGITPQNIDDTLYDAFGQRLVSTIYTQLNQYHVVLEALPGFQHDPRSLDDIFVKSAAGTQVPLSTFTHFEEESSPLVISHQGQFPAVTLSFNLAPKASLGEAVSKITKLTKGLNMPLSVNADFQGSAHAFTASLANEGYLILAALVTVYIVLGVLYESFIHPITILSTLPSAGVGAVLAMLIFREDLGVIAIIGIILLIGIVKKNAIMMIDFALEAERHHGKTPEEAIYEACLLRFRPIMMTTFAALLGAVPLALGNGTGMELRRPLGIVIIGGLVLSQAMTLFSTPVIYLFFDRLAVRFGGNEAEPEMQEGHAAPAD